MRQPRLLKRGCLSLTLRQRVYMQEERKTLEDLKRVTAEARAMWSTAHAAIESAQQTHENVKAQVDELAKLNGLRGAFLDKMLGKILDSAMASVDSTVGSIQLLNSETGFTIHASAGIPRESVDAFSLSHAARPSLLEEMHSHCRLHIQDIAERTFLFTRPSLEVMLDAGVRSMQIVCLPETSGSVRGVLCISQTTPYRPTARGWRLLDYYARCAAMLTELYGNGVAKR